MSIKHGADIIESLNISGNFNSVSTGNLGEPNASLEFPNAEAFLNIGNNDGPTGRG